MGGGCASPVPRALRSGGGRGCTTGSARCRRAAPRQRPDSAGTPLRPLPGGSSLKPPVQVKNTLARCLFQRTDAGSRTGRGRGWVMPCRSCRLPPPALTGRSGISEPAPPGHEQTAGEAVTHRRFASPITGSACERRPSNRNVAPRELGGSGDFAACRQFGLMDLPGKRTGSAPDKQLCLQSPGWGSSRRWSDGRRGGGGRAASRELHDARLIGCLKKFKPKFRG